MNKSVKVGTWVVVALAIAAGCARAAAIVGLDWGSQFHKIGVLPSGRYIEIALNVFSKRKTETLVAFNGAERLYGKDAAGFASRKPKQTFAHVRDLLGSLDYSNEVEWLEAHGYSHDRKLVNAQDGEPPSYELFSHRLRVPRMKLTRLRNSQRWY